MKAAQQRQRSVIILPGLGNCAADYDDLVANLVEKATQETSDSPLRVSVLPVARIDWLRNALGLLGERERESTSGRIFIEGRKKLFFKILTCVFSSSSSFCNFCCVDGNYWRGTLKPRPTVDWYLNKLETCIQEARDETSGGPITLLAHSAGGWMGRTYLVEKESPGDCGVDCFVSLGSPHSPPPKEAAGVVDQTRGILTWVNETTPGAFHEGVKYVSICGKYIKGARIDAKEVSVEQKITGQGYKQVCGSSEVWGDGIVPEDSAHLEGALQIDLEGIYHSPLGKGDDKKWYGDSDVVDQWWNNIYVDP